MKLLSLAVTAALVAQVSAAEVPKIFAGLFEKDVPVRGEIGVIVPPQAIDKYVAKVEDAARKDPTWFREHSKKAKRGTPVPYDEKLGLTKQEYDDYLKLWSQREFKRIGEPITMLLRDAGDGNWNLTSTGAASTISTLRYSPKDDLFRSPNGDLKRISDINEDNSSILGVAWNAHEWRFEEESNLGKTQENIAIGQYTDKRYGLVVYRVQEISSEGTRLLDKSLVIRFVPGKAAAAKPADAAKPAVKPAAKPETVKPAATKPAPKPAPQKKK